MSNWPKISKKFKQSNLSFFLAVHCLKTVKNVKKNIKQQNIVTKEFFFVKMYIKYHKGKKI